MNFTSVDGELTGFLTYDDTKDLYISKAFTYWEIESIKFSFASISFHESLTSNAFF